MKILFLGDVWARGARSRVAAGSAMAQAMGARFRHRQWRKCRRRFWHYTAIAEAFFEAGVDVISTGNHVWDQQEIQGYMTLKIACCGR